MTTEEMLAEALRVCLRCMEEAATGAFKNGNTDPNGTIDEGEVLTFDWVKRGYAVLAAYDQARAEAPTLDLELLAKLASGEGGQRTGALIRAGLLEVRVTEAGLERPARSGQARCDWPEHQCICTGECGSHAGSVGQALEWCERQGESCCMEPDHRGQCMDANGAPIETKPPECNHQFESRMDGGQWCCKCQQRKPGPRPLPVLTPAESKALRKRIDTIRKPVDRVSVPAAIREVHARLTEKYRKKPQPAPKCRTCGCGGWTKTGAGLTLQCHRCPTCSKP